MRYGEDCDQGTYLERSEMNNAIDSRMRSKDFVELILVGEINLVENRSLARNKFDTVKSDFGRVV